MLRRAVTWVVLLATTLLVSAELRAEFYTWTDRNGQPRVSNIPPRGVGADGRIEGRFNPLSIEAQQAALRRRLRTVDAQLEADRAALQSSAAPAARSK